MTAKELYQRARFLNVAGRSKMTKSQLEKAINKVASTDPALMDVEAFVDYLRGLAKGLRRKVRKQMRACGQIAKASVVL